MQRTRLLPILRYAALSLFLLVPTAGQATAAPPPFRRI